MALIWEKALRHDWPVTLGSGIPACQTRPGRALRGLCDWVETDFAVEVTPNKADWQAAPELAARSLVANAAIQTCAQHM